MECNHQQGVRQELVFSRCYDELQALNVGAWSSQFILGPRLWFPPSPGPCEVSQGYRDRLEPSHNRLPAPQTSQHCWQAVWLISAVLSLTGSAR